MQDWRGGRIGVVLVVVAGCTSLGCAAVGPPSATAATAEATDSNPSAPRAEVATPNANASALNQRLATAGKREVAVKEAIAAFASAARNGTQTPQARAFVEQHGQAAAQAYIEGSDELTPPTRTALLRLLVGFNDASAVPAFIQAISAYARTGQDPDAAIWACQGALQRKAPGYRAALLESYLALDTSDKDGLRYSRHLAAAMSYQRDDTWQTTFVEALGQPLERPTRFDDKEAVKAFQSGLFRQTIAARLLGEMGAANGARPLLNVLLDPDKRELYPTAELALIQLSRSATPILVGLLEGREPELAARTRAARPDVKESEIYFATKWLDLMRQPSTGAPLLAAWSQSRDPVSRVLLVRSLSVLPHSNAAIDALKSTFAKTDIKTTLPEGESGLEVLANAAVQFFDPSLVGWLNERTSHVPVVWSRRGDVQLALVLAMSKLVAADQLKDSRVLAQRFGGKTGTPAFEAAQTLVQRCQQDGTCYAKVLQTPGSVSTDADTFVQLKAATMSGCVGDGTTLQALVDSIALLQQAEVVAQVLAAIEHLSVDEPAQTAQRLERLTSEVAGDANGNWPRAKQLAVAATIARLKGRI